MRLISVLVAVSLTAIVSANAWPDVKLEYSAASSLIFGALGSADAAAPCKCAIPRECTTTSNACECFNNAAVSCWIGNGQSCRLDLQNCGAPNSPPTSSNSQFPPCLSTSGSGANPLPPCAATASCRKLDNSCYDWNRSGSGGCIGICVPKTLGQKPKQAQPPNPQPPTQSGPAWQWQPQPNTQPAAPGRPAGPTWGTPGAPAASKSPPAASQWTPPPGGPPPAQTPTQAPPSSLGQGAQNVGACPANIKCPGNNVCTPDPKKRDTFLCIQPLDTCAGIQDVQCQPNKSCVADPRMKCKGQKCAGLCV